MLCCRLNTIWEFLVFLIEDKLSLPVHIPSQYSHRILKHDSESEWCVIQSKVHPTSTRTSMDLLAKGIWICEGDCQAFGNVGPSVFGVPLCQNAVKTFYHHKQKLFDYQTQEHGSTSTWKQARVAYHGTSEENYRGICDTGFRCTFGMLGTGLYLGSFWKACRFAARDQDYKLRDSPTVLRVIWICSEEQLLLFPRPILYCLCAECYTRPEQRHFCAHTLDWQQHAKTYPKKTPSEYPSEFTPETLRYYAGFLAPCKYPQSEKYVTQNEEWVINPSCILRLAESARLNLDTVDKPHYNPLQRTIKIL
jgi:hypothetical protein